MRCRHRQLGETTYNSKLHDPNRNSSPEDRFSHLHPSLILVHEFLYLYRLEAIGTDPYPSSTAQATDCQGELQQRLDNHLP